MPYITQECRQELAATRYPDNPGELNFMITKLCIEYLDTKESYTAFNSIIGVLECAKLEFYRRMITPYENKKIEENGDVYE